MLVLFAGRIRLNRNFSGSWKDGLYVAIPPLDHGSAGWLVNALPEAGTYVSHAIGLVQHMAEQWLRNVGSAFRGMCGMHMAINIFVANFRQIA